MEFKGTKGKWTVEEKENTVYDQSVFAISTNHNEEFITVWNGVENFQEEQRANALLISKAPEMLLMLQRLRLDYEMIIPYFPRRNEIGNEIEKLIKEATEL